MATNDSKESPLSPHENILYELLIYSEWHQEAKPVVRLILTYSL